MDRVRQLPLRVLAADDSAVMREILRMVFNLAAGAGFAGLPPMQLCGVARDGVEALAMVRELKPDVLLLDLEMPRLDGLGVLKQLQLDAPTLPVIMCSAYTERGARATLDALSCGAKDYVMKPTQGGDLASALDRLMAHLLPRIAALAGKGHAASPDALAHSSPEKIPVAQAAPATALRPAASSAASPAQVLVIGVSTGGPAALEELLPVLTRDLPVPVLIVQHMPRLFLGVLIERLNRLCPCPVQQAQSGETLRPGQVLLAPGDSHMEISQGTSMSRVVFLHQKAALNSCKPSADYLLQSAARFYGSAALAMILTGMGQDGFAGAQAVVGAGGTVLAQDEASSAVWGMPGCVARAGLAAETLPLNRLAEAARRRFTAERSAERSLAAMSAFTHRETTYGLH